MTTILDMPGRDDYSSDKKPTGKTVCANCKVHSAPDIGGYFDPSVKPPRIVVSIACLNCDRRWKTDLVFPSAIWDMVNQGDSQKAQEKEKPKQERTIDPKQVEELKKQTTQSIQSFGKTYDFDKEIKPRRQSWNQ